MYVYMYIYIYIYAACTFHGNSIACLRKPLGSTPFSTWISLTCSFILNSKQVRLICARLRRHHNQAG